jgi:uncharacterized membrane protein YphA (DoxX/SURF4 family)
VRRAPLPWLGLAIRLAAASIWLFAGIAKIADLERFHSQVHAYELLPHALEAPFAYTLPFVETGNGLYLALGLLVRPAAILGSVLMAAFIVAMAQAWARGLSLDCGCFGAAVQERVGLTSILRDAALGLPTVVLALWPARKLSLDTTVLGKPDGFTLHRSDPPDVYAAAA